MVIQGDIGRYTSALAIISRSALAAERDSGSLLPAGDATAELDARAAGLAGPAGQARLGAASVPRTGAGEDEPLPPSARASSCSSADEESSAKVSSASASRRLSSEPGVLSDCSDTVEPGVGKCARQLGGRLRCGVLSPIARGLCCRGCAGNTRSESWLLPTSSAVGSGSEGIESSATGPSTSRANAPVAKMAWILSTVPTLSSGFLGSGALRPV